MQLEQLQSQWNQLDQKLEQVLKVQNELLQRSVAPVARRRVRRLAFWPAIDVALALAAIIWLVSFVVAHFPSWPLVAPAAIVLAASYLLLIDSIRQLVQIGGIDWAGPVAKIQTSLAGLRIAKIRQFKWLMLFAPLVGFSGLLVLLQTIGDALPAQVAIVDKLNPWWIAANYAFGLLFIPFSHVLIGFLARRFGSTSWWQSALDYISGKSLAESREELEVWTHLQP